MKRNESSHMVDSFFSSYLIPHELKHDGVFVIIIIIYILNMEKNIVLYMKKKNIRGRWCNDETFLCINVLYIVTFSFYHRFWNES